MDYDLYIYYEEMEIELASPDFRNSNCFIKLFKEFNRLYKKVNGKEYSSTCIQLNYTYYLDLVVNFCEDHHAKF